MNDRVIAEIDLQAIKNNLLAIKKDLAKDIKIMSVLKANAYGHGAVQVAKFTQNIIDYIAVATLQEGVLLRKQGIAKPILVLGETVSAKLKIANKYEIMTTIYSKEIFDQYTEFAQKHSLVIKVHLKIDTGMNRIGIRYDDFDTINNIFTSPYINIDGIFTHLAKAQDNFFTERQRNNFIKVLDYLRQKNIKIPLCHMANSIGCKNEKNNFDCVRIGLEQYIPQKENLYPSMTLKAKIIQIKDVAKGESVGYDLAYTAKKRIRVAVVAVGYADGLMRCLSNTGKVFVNGVVCDIVGNVCMDFTMIDITNAGNVKTGDYVTIFGKEIITANDIAQMSSTISYEIVTHLSQRVKKIYIS
ncbi:MAG: alanine racemase [Clostridiales bacterium]|nr:alanine racemase [Clostridiales bacterium]